MGSGVYFGPVGLDCSQSTLVAPDGDFGAASIYISAGSSPFDVSWSGQSSGNSIAYNTGEHLIENLQEGAYSVTVTDANSCTASCNVHIELIKETNEEQSICKGECVEIGKEAKNEDTACYKWEPADQFDNPNIPFQNVCPEKDITYTLQISTADGNILEEITYSFIVHEQTPIELAVLPGDQGFCSFPVKVEATEGFVSYEWSDGESTSASNIIQANEEGLYTVTATDDNGCTSTAEVNLDQSNVGALAIKGKLEEKGFYGVPISSIAPAGFNGNSDPNSLMPGLVDDYANLKIEIVDAFVDVEEYLENYLSFSFFEHITTKKSYATSNTNICEENPDLFEQLCAELDQQDLGIWSHIWEDPDATGTGTLYFLAKSPTTTEGFASMSDFGEHFMERVITDPSIEALPTKDDEIIYCIQDQLVNFYEIDLSIDHLNITDQNKETHIAINCNISSVYDVIAINPAGIPIKIGKDASLIYGPPEHINGNFDHKALGGFSKYGYTWMAFGDISINHHGGFKSLRNNEFYEFESLEGISPVHVVLGDAYIDPDDNCIAVDYTEYPFQPNWPWISTNIDNITFPTLNIYPNGTGIYINTNFLEYSQLGTFDQINPTLVFSTSYCRFGGAFTHESFLNPVSFDLKKPGTVNSTLPNSMLYRVNTNNNVDSYVFGTYHYDTPEEMTYYKWNCIYGVWVEFILMT